MSLEFVAHCLVGSMLGGMIGVLWSWTMVTNRRRRAERVAVLDQLNELQPRTGARKEDLSAKQFREIKKAFAEPDRSFKSVVASSQLIWAFSGLGLSLVPRIYGGVASGTLTAAFLLAYCGTFVIAACVCYFHRQRVFICERAASAMADGLGQEVINAIRAVYSQSFTESGTFVPGSVVARETNLVAGQRRVERFEELAKTRLHEAEKAALEASKLRIENSRMSSTCLQLGETLGFVTTAAQEFAAIDGNLRAIRDPKDLIRPLRLLLKRLAEALGGPESCRAAFYVFSSDPSQSAGFPVAEFSAIHADGFDSAPISRDWSVVEHALRTGHMNAVSLSQSRDGADVPRWGWAVLVPIPFLQGCGDTGTVAARAVLRIDTSQPPPTDLRDPRDVQMRALGTIAEIIRRRTGWDFDALYQYCQERRGDGDAGVRKAAV